jgi:hypothetical protein
LAPCATLATCTTLGATSTGLGATSSFAFFLCYEGYLFVST